MMLQLRLHRNYLHSHTHPHPTIRCDLNPSSVRCPKKTTFPSLQIPTKTTIHYKKTYSVDSLANEETQNLHTSIGVPLVFPPPKIDSKLPTAGIAPAVLSLTMLWEMLVKVKGTEMQEAAVLGLKMLWKTLVKVKVKVMGKEFQEAAVRGLKTLWEMLANLKEIQEVVLSVLSTIQDVWLILVGERTKGLLGGELLRILKNFACFLKKEEENKAADGEKENSKAKEDGDKKKDGGDGEDQKEY